MKQSKKIIIFDLDGTILDTIADITTAVNRALESFGYPKRKVDEVKSFLGNGSLTLIRRCLPNGGDDDHCREIRTRFREEYQKCMLEKTIPYNGISDLIDELNEKGIISVVLTNKDDKSAVPMIEHYFGNRFAFVRGVKTDFDRKPNPEVALSIISNFGFTPESALIIGDGMADLNVAKNAGIDFLPIGYGYTPTDRLFSECQKTPVSDVFSLRCELLKYLD